MRAGRGRTIGRGRERPEGGRDREKKDGTLLVLKMKEGARNQGMKLRFGVMKSKISGDGGCMTL